MAETDNRLKASARLFALSSTSSCRIVWLAIFINPCARMKTTIELPDTLFAQAKRLAKARNMTMKALIEQGVRNSIAEQVEVPPFRLRDGSFRGEGGSLRSSETPTGSRLAMRSTRLAGRRKTGRDCARHQSAGLRAPCGESVLCDVARCVEDLRVGNMSRSAAGTVDAPGRNVRAKSGLNKAILDQGWFEFRRQLEYKLQWNGGQLIAVAPHHTSRSCPDCGHVSKDNRRTQARFACVRCGFEGNADLVGAINVLRAGQARSACQVSGASRPPATGTHRSDPFGPHA